MRGLVSCVNVFWIWFQDDDALQDWRDRQVLVSSKFCSLSDAEQDWGRVCLEACDGLWPPSLHITIISHHKEEKEEDEEIQNVNRASKGMQGQTYHHVWACLTIANTRAPRDGWFMCHV